MSPTSLEAAFGGFGDDSGCCDSVAGEGGGRVVMITISHSDQSCPYVERRLQPSIHAGNGLRTDGILAAWHLPATTANVPPMSDLVGPKK